MHVWEYWNGASGENSGVGVQFIYGVVCYRNIKAKLG